MPLTPKEQQAAAQAQSFYAKAWRVYDFVFFRLVRYGAAVRAYLAKNVRLEPGDKVLDAGCGTGLLTKTLYTTAQAAGINNVTFHAFDLTPQMLGALDDWVASEGASNVETALFNVLELADRPEGWDTYNWIVTSAMMEYLPRTSLALALKGLRTLLSEDGRLLLVITRRNWLTNVAIGKLWHSNLYTRRELRDIIRQAGFESVTFKDFPGVYKGFGRMVILVEMN